MIPLKDIKLFHLRPFLVEHINAEEPHLLIAQQRLFEQALYNEAREVNTFGNFNNLLTRLETLGYSYRTLLGFIVRSCKSHPMNWVEGLNEEACQKFLNETAIGEIVVPEK